MYKLHWYRFKEWTLEWIPGRKSQKLQDGIEIGDSE